ADQAADVLANVPCPQTSAAGAAAASIYQAAAGRETWNDRARAPGRLWQRDQLAREVGHVFRQGDVQSVDRNAVLDRVAGRFPSGEGLAGAEQRLESDGDHSGDKDDR